MNIHHDNQDSGLLLPDLIRTLKGDRTFEEMEAQSGGVVRAQRWHQLANGERISEFPKPATIEAMADTLPCDREVLLLAFARFVGIDVHRRQSRFIDLLPPSIDNLSEGSKSLLLSTARALTDAERVGGQEPKTGARGAVVKAAAKKKKGARYSPRPDVPPA